MATASTALGHAHIATIGDGVWEDGTMHRSEREATVATGMDSFTWLLAVLSYLVSRSSYI